jgi:hypothetical protein
MVMILDVLNESLMITGFVFVMMLVIEYLNVLTRGEWQQKIAATPTGQYLFAILMGLFPGCLGSFAIVAMFTGRLVSIGGVIAAMIVTTGDEAFVMLSVIPTETFMLMGILAVIGLVAGVTTDFILKKQNFPVFSTLFSNKIYAGSASCDGFKLHTEDSCKCYPNKNLLTQWKESSPNRILLALVLSLFIISLLTGQVGPEEWDWIRITILIVTSLALFIVSTVPEHFLKEHLWNHVAMKHVPRIFAWTFGAMLSIHFLTHHVHLDAFIQNNLWTVLGGAGLIGLLPESGPHLIFVTLFKNGSIPFSILLASSIVQDGHGLLPLLPESPKTFIFVKLVNLLFGILTGAILLGFTLWI